ncbi:MAG: branched-chain amino acid ABC transporter permease [Desulfurococcales archaeon]|nr:branched-chain amino acid ABC transporter permease [Desulfurococcales archaeon]
MAGKAKILGTRIFGLALLVIILGLVPPALGFNIYYVLLAAIALSVTVMVAAWNIIGGYAGQLDLAAPVYFVIGSFVTTHLLVFYHVIPWIGILVGALAAVALATVLGYPTFCVQIERITLFIITSYYFPILGSNEVYISQYIPKDANPWLYLYFPMNYTIYYYIFLALLVFTVWINLKIKRSKLGYYLAAIREDELAAEALGIDVRRYKLYALMIYAAILGVAGGFHIMMIGILAYKNFDPWLGIVIAVMGIVGGLGSIEGAVMSGLILRTIEEWLRSSFGAVIPGIHYLIYGVIIIVVAILKPEGLAAIINYVKKKLGLIQYG